MEPLISIVMPNYNGSRTLKTAIDSVLAQTYQNFELIIVDDGSTDDSVRVIRSFEDERIRPIITGENRQICMALNTGLAAAKGTYIARLDSDDAWEPEKLEKQAAYLQAHPECGACFTRVTVMDENGDPDHDNEIFKIFDRDNQEREAWIREFFFGANCLCHPSVMIPAEVLKAVGPYHSIYRQLQDYEMWIRILGQFKIHILPERLVRYRRDTVGSSVSASNAENDTRTFNENLMIHRHFFDNMDPDVLIRAFRGEFRGPLAKGAGVSPEERDAHLLCEQGFLLLKTDYRLAGIELLGDLLMQAGTLALLETDYSFTPKDYYKLMAEEIASRGSSYQEALEAYQKAMDQLHKTEAEYLATIDQLNETVSAKLAADEQLHKTEKEYLATISHLEEACSQVQERDQQILAQNQQILEQNQQLAALRAEQEALLHSGSWKLTKPLRACGHLARRTKHALSGKKRAEEKAAAAQQKARELAEREAREAEQAKKDALVSLTEVSEEEMERQRKKVFENPVKISIITPLFNTPEPYLKELIESVLAQTYGNWEFCMINFSTTDFERVDAVCRTYADADPRILYRVEKENKGISENTNVCISYASGEYIALLDHDDLLHPCALYEAMEAISQGADFIYTDEVKFTTDTKDLFLPNFKPDFSAEELRAHNYICHFNVYARSLFDQTEGYRKEFDGSQDHDMVLRLTEKAEKILHIPKILYYWRVHQGSVAQNISAKSYATDAGELAVTDQLSRMHEDQYAESIVGRIPVYRLRERKAAAVSVTAVIWGSTDPEKIEKSRKSLAEAGIEKVVIADAGKETSQAWNEAAEGAESTFVLFLQAGLVFAGEAPATEIMLYRNRKGLAAVDGKVLMEDHSIYSGGMYLSTDEAMPLHLRCMGGGEDYAGYENGMMHARSVIAAAGLCTAVRTDALAALGGFSSCGAHTNPMPEFTMRAQKAGYGCVWTPFLKVRGLTEAEKQSGICGLTENRTQIEPGTDPYLSGQVIALRLE